jgi:hypothetical protein
MDLEISRSQDQTPYRKDERERCKAAGADVMTMDQMEGLEPMHENWGLTLGEETDDGGDPPRLWLPGASYPGCAFTRSIGDDHAEAVGVFAVPEVRDGIVNSRAWHALTLLCSRPVLARPLFEQLLVKFLSTSDVFVCLASDGVWECSSPINQRPHPRPSTGPHPEDTWQVCGSSSPINRWPISS